MACGSVGGFCAGFALRVVLLGLPLLAGFACFSNGASPIACIKKPSCGPFIGLLSGFSGFLPPRVHHHALRDCERFYAIYGGKPLVIPLDSPLESRLMIRIISWKKRPPRSKKMRPLNKKRPQSPNSRSHFKNLSLYRVLSISAAISSTRF